VQQKHLSRCITEGGNEFPEEFLIESKGALEAYLGRELTLEDCREIITNLVNLEEFLQNMKQKGSC
jgi:hypothetical protein